MPLLPADAHIGQVSLAVASLDRSVAFYTDVIGLTVLSRNDGAAVLGATANGRGILRLEMQTGAAPRRRRTSGLYHVAFLVPSRAALGRSLRRLFDRDWRLTGASDHLVSEALYLDDPDGLGLEIYRDRPSETWEISEGEVVMATEPLDLSSLAAEPGAEAPWNGFETGTVIGHVHLHVPDLARAEELYCGTIGFRPTLRRYPGALFVAAGSYHHHVGLNVWAGRGAPPPAPEAVGLRAFTVQASGLPAETVIDRATGVSISYGSAA